MTKVLVVEDDKALAKALAINLRARGDQAVVAHDGATALRSAAAEPPDVVLLDLGLPDMDGAAALREIRADRATADVRVVAFTAHAMHGDRDRALAAGFDDYLTKPIDFATFSTTVGGLLQ